LQGGAATSAEIGTSTAAAAAEHPCGWQFKSATDEGETVTQASYAVVHETGDALNNLLLQPVSVSLLNAKNDEIIGVAQVDTRQLIQESSDFTVSAQLHLEESYQQLWNPPLVAEDENEGAEATENSPDADGTAPNELGETQQPREVKDTMITLRIFVSGDAAEVDEKNHIQLNQKFKGSDYRRSFKIVNFSSSGCRSAGRCGGLECNYGSSDRRVQPPK
jgi:hypothetical protein